MSYLNLDLTYFEHPKTVRLTGLLGRGAEVLPIRLWTYCGRVHAEDGRLSGYSTRELESAIGWWGKEGDARAGMVKVGFVRELADGAGFEVVDWTQHQGHLAAFKRRARAAALARWKEAGDTPSNASSIAKDDAKQCPNLPNQPDQPTPTDGGAAPRRRRTFEPPTVEQVRAYCQERGNAVDAQRFVDHYAARGWKPKGYSQQMTDWKAAVRTWERAGGRSSTTRPAAAAGKYADVGERHEL